MSYQALVTLVAIFLIIGILVMMLIGMYREIKRQDRELTRMHEQCHFWQAQRDEMQAQLKRREGPAPQVPSDQQLAAIRRAVEVEESECPDNNEAYRMILRYDERDDSITFPPHTTSHLR